MKNDCETAGGALALCCGATWRFALSQGSKKALRRKNRTQRGKNAEAQGGSAGQQGAAKVRQVLQHVKVDIGVKGMIGIGEQIDQIFNERIYNKQLDRQHKKFLRKKAAPECRCIPILGGAVWEQQALAELQHIAELWPRKAPGYEFEVRAALSRVIFLLAENCLQHAQAPSERDLRDAERIKQMIDFVRAHRAEAITTEQIAASAAISVSECLRCFRRMMDLTPKEYLRQHRIRHAVQLLENTDKSITRIGEECGFEDMSYFARVFRAEKGCTPSEYRSMGR